MVREIDDQRKKLDAMFERSRDLPDDPEIKSHWAKYLCVLVCGFLENSVELCLCEYCKHRSSPPIQNYVRSQLHYFQNPKMDEIIRLFGSFNSDWQTRLETECSGELSDAVNSIVGNRHKIAHGGSVSLTIGGLQKYYHKALKVVELLQRICSVA